MAVKSSILLTGKQHRFAKKLVEAGRYRRTCLSQHILAGHVCDVDIDDVRCGYLAFTLSSGNTVSESGTPSKAASVAPDSTGRPGQLANWN